MGQLYYFAFIIYTHTHTHFIITCHGLAGALALACLEWRVDFTPLFPLYKRSRASVETISSPFFEILEREK